MNKIEPLLLSDGTYFGEYIIHDATNTPMRNGEGVFRRDDGTVFDGIWVSDEFTKGTMTTYNEKYIGTFKNFEKDGFGKLFYKDGSVYEGEFKNNKCHGKGTLFFNDNEKYIGEFLNDKMHGFGANDI